MSDPKLHDDDRDRSPAGSVLDGDGSEEQALNPALAPTEVPREREPGAVGMDLVQARVHQRLFGGAMREVSIGRFTVVATAGAGGLGIVYEAFDPELDRRVAIKLVSASAGGSTASSQARLLAEAQTMARLSHPNIVTVHEVGEWDGRVFIAMEHVDGQTLERWVHGSPPQTAQQILRAYIQAGHGLAAAHRAGIIHRDFKPTNAMIDRTGRVRVLDFGLAIADGDERSSASSSPGSDGRTAATHGGTPLYMSPEQRERKPVTARSDQYSFCVSLWEALHGERPVEGQTAKELALPRLAGRPGSSPKRRSVPRWLRRACARGLALDPAQRWPSMDALLDALAKGRMRAGIRKGLAVAGVVVLLGAGVEARRRWDVARRTAACEAAGAEIAAVWSPEREQALRGALVATGVGSAATTADRVMPWLDRQAEAWREARAEVCLDADVRARWDADTLDRSLWCLDARRMELESLVDELTHADAGVVHKAVTAAATLASVPACRDEAALATMPPPPADREALRAVRADVIRASNLERAGAYGDGLELARRALARAEALAWPPLTAEARVRHGWLLERSGAFADAEAELERAYFDAGKGVAPGAAFDAALGLVRTVGLDAARHVEGRRWARLADLALEDVRDGEGLRRARLLSVLATVELAAGSFDEAMALQQRGLALYEQALGGEHPSVATSLQNLANVHYAAGDRDEAKRLYEQAIAISKTALGPEHPDVANGLNNLAAVLQGSGAYDEAAALYAQGLAIREEALGSRHPDVAKSLSNLAAVRTATGAHDEASALLERAIAIREETLGPEHPELAQSLANLAIVRESTGAYAEAELLLQRALAISKTALGPEHPDVANLVNNLANVKLSTHAYADAEPLYEQAIVVWEKALGPEHPNLAYSLMGLAQVRLAQHRPAEAIPPALRAVTARAKAGVAVTELADARFVLARALWDAPVDAGRDRARAVALAEQARDALHAAGEAGAPILAELEPWLAERRDGP